MRELVFALEYEPGCNRVPMPSSTTPIPVSARSRCMPLPSSVKREFSRDDGQVDILVCTDSASEGLNLQECGALINYDLPWNPMRVEQRIGRIDRIGQRFDEIRTLNYSNEDMVETDIYDRLDDRIGLFENVVGEMQPILSGVSQQIRDATLNADNGDNQTAVESADREFSELLEERDQGDRVDVGESLEDIDDLECPDEIQQRARTLAEQAEEGGVTTGAHPVEFAAACLYKAGREEGRWLTQSDVAECGNVTPTTVRAHHETLEEQVV